MAKRITGSSVSRGDLVRRKYTQLTLQYEKRDMHAEKIGYSELGIVLTTNPPYDRSMGKCDCRVFWSWSKTIEEEHSIDLKILSPAC